MQILRLRKTFVGYSFLEKPFEACVKEFIIVVKRTVLAICMSIIMVLFKGINYPLWPSFSGLQREPHVEGCYFR